MKPVILATASALLLAACQTNSYDSLAYGPTLTPVGQGLEAGRMPVPSRSSRPRSGPSAPPTI